MDINQAAMREARRARANRRAAQNASIDAMRLKPRGANQPPASRPRLTRAQINAQAARGASIGNAAITPRPPGPGAGGTRIPATPPVDRPLQGAARIRATGAAGLGLLQGLSLGGGRLERELSGRASREREAILQDFRSYFFGANTPRAAGDGGPQPDLTRRQQVLNQRNDRTVSDMANAMLSSGVTIGGIAESAQSRRARQGPGGPGGGGGGGSRPLQAAPGSGYQPMTVGSGDFNRRVEMNRMVQQATSGSSPWAPGAREAAVAAEGALLGARAASRDMGRPETWDLPETSDPRQEAYWQRADMRQWAGANFDLANRLRERKGLSRLERDASGNILWGQGNTVSPYAEVFAKPAGDNTLAGFRQDAPLVQPGSANTGNIAFPASTAVNPSTAFGGGYGDLVPSRPQLDQPLAPATQAAALAGYRGQGVQPTGDVRYSGTGLMAPIPQEEKDLIASGFRGGGLEDDFLRRFLLANK